MMTEYEWLDTFAGNLRSIMDECCMSQRELSRQTGISEGNISRYLNRQCMPSVNALINIAYVFPCADIGDLLCFDDRVEMRPSRRW